MNTSSAVRHDLTALALGLTTCLACSSDPSPQQGAEGSVATTDKGAEEGAHAPHRIDRLGRMEITNTYLQSHKESYNREETFNIENSHLAIYAEPLGANLHIFDMMDGVNNWTPSGGESPLTPLLLQDYLLVDISKPCTVDSRSYLEIEKAVFRGTEYTTCGGRAPNDAALDVMLTLVINGPDRDEPWRTDGTKGATQPSTNTFPYLADPN